MLTPFHYRMPGSVCTTDSFAGGCGSRPEGINLLESRSQIFSVFNPILCVSQTTGSKANNPEAHSSVSGGIARTLLAAGSIFKA